LPAICGEGVTAAGTPLPTPAAADATAGADVTGTHAAAAVPPLPAICGEGVTAAGTPLPTPAAADATAGAGVTGTHAAAAVPPLPAVDGAEPAVGGTVLAVCDTEPEPAVGGTAPAVGGTIASGTPPATIDGRREAIIPSGGVQIGWILLGHCSSSKKNIALYDNKRCRVVAVLRKEYRVTMLEGPNEGFSVKYKHENVTVLRQIGNLPAAADIAGTVDGADSDAKICADGLLCEAQQAAPDQGASTTMNPDEIWGEDVF
jgi:hypothetical protein